MCGCGYGFRIHFLVTGILAAFTSPVWGQQPTIEILAVEVNGQPITPTNNLVAEGGDIIEAEFWLSHWSPEGQKLRAFQITLDHRQMTNECGGLIPLGYDNPRYDCTCQVDADCGACAGAPDCFTLPTAPNPTPLFCAGPEHDPSQGLFIIVTHNPTPNSGCPLGFSTGDYVFAPGCLGDLDLDFRAVDFSLPNIRWAATRYSNEHAKTYTVPRYAGTLKLRVSDNAGGLNGAGVYVVGMLPDQPIPDGPDTTFLADTFGQVIPLPPATLVRTPLTVTVNVLCERWWPCINGSTPKCSIDARQPSRPDGTLPDGWQEFDLEFDGSTGGGVPTLEDFETCRVVPYLLGEPLPIVQSITPHDGNMLRVRLDQRIAPGKWTCIRYNPPTGNVCGIGGAPARQEVCFAHLPGDVTNDRTASAADITWLIDCLNGLRTCQIHQCDIDRSGICGPPDILRTIDLLNGAGVFDPWLNRTIVACPSP